MATNWAELKIAGLTVPRDERDTPDVLAQRRRVYDDLGDPAAGLPQDETDVFVELRDMVAELPFINRSHRPIFDLLVAQMAIARRAAALIREDGVTKPGNRNGTVRHPAATTLNDSTRIARGLLTDLGMTPASAAVILKKSFVSEASSNPFDADLREFLTGAVAQ